MEAPQAKHKRRNAVRYRSPEGPDAPKTQGDGRVCLPHIPRASFPGFSCPWSVLLGYILAVNSRGQGGAGSWGQRQSRPTSDDHPRA